MLSSQCPSSFILSTRRRLQCTVTMFLTVGHASLLRFLLCMKSNVDQFVSQDPAEVTWDRTLTAMCSGVWAPNDIHQLWLIISLALCAQLFAFWLMNFMNFMSFIIKFIKFKPIIKFKKLELDNYAIQYDTARDAILTCNQKLTRVSIIYRTEPTRERENRKI